MSAFAEATVTLIAETLARVPVRAMRQTGVALVRAAALAFYLIGRAVLKLTRAPRSETGVPEAVVGFLIVAGLVVSLVKLPLRLLLAGFMR